MNLSFRVVDGHDEFYFVNNSANPIGQEKALKELGPDGLVLQGAWKGSQSLL